MTTKGTLHITFEYDPYNGDPGTVELAVHFGFIPGAPETGRFGPVEGYDPGSAHEAWLEGAEREVERDGKMVWTALIPGEWLESWCVSWLASRDEAELVEGLTDDGRDEGRD